MDGDPLSIERGVRQRLADKILDNMAGLWLLVPEHLRLGTWDLLRSWTRQPTERIEPRLALLSTKGSVQPDARTALTICGFETLSDCPSWPPTPVHVCSTAHRGPGRGTPVGWENCVAPAAFDGKLLLIDPTARPASANGTYAATKGTRLHIKAQTFFCLMATVSSRCALPRRGPPPPKPLLSADAEHFATCCWTRSAPRRL
jgi:hypothetical protein